MDNFYDILENLPTGKVTTYSAIAKELSISPRQVGRLLHNNKDPIKYPCHRVVFKDGSLAPSYAFGGQEVQKKKLLSEGIKFKTNGKVLKEYIVF